MGGLRRSDWTLWGHEWGSPGLLLPQSASWLVPKRGSYPWWWWGCLGGSQELTCTGKPSAEEAREPCSSGERLQALLE